MEIKGEYRIAADRETVWAALHDAAVLQKCIPGCESLSQVSGHEFTGRVMASIGPVRAKFDTRLTLENLDPPARYTLTGESKAGAAGFGRGRAEVWLSAEEPGTLLRYSADFRVGGKLAQVGSRLVLGATRKTADDFFGRLARELDSGAPKVATPDPAASKRAAASLRWIGAIAAAAVVLLTFWILLR